MHSVASIELLDIHPATVLSHSVSQVVEHLLFLLYQNLVLDLRHLLDILAFFHNNHIVVIYVFDYN